MTTITRKRKLSELNEGEDVTSSSPPRQKMRLEISSEPGELNQSFKPLDRAIEFEDNIMEEIIEWPELPAEIWLEILASLPLDSLTPIPFVCQTWHQLSKDQKLSWWYIKRGLLLKDDNGKRI